MRADDDQDSEGDSAMDPSGQFDPTNSPASEGDLRDPAQQALDRSGASDDTSYEGLLGEPSGASAGATGVVGEPSGTGAGASGIAGSSAGATGYEGMADTPAGDLASPASGQGIDPRGYDTTNQGLGSQAYDSSHGGLSGMNNDPNQNYDPNQGGMSGQGNQGYDPNQGAQGDMPNDPNQGGMRGDQNDDPNQGGQGYNDPSSNS
jgi:hypothetical protein